jgi:hypothetical protein
MAKSSRLLRKKKTQRNKKYRHTKRRITRKYKNMRGGVIQINDENPTYEYFQFIPKKTLFGTAKDKELDILVSYTNNTDKYESFRILEKNKNGKFVENLLHSELQYEFACGSVNDNYDKIDPLTGKSSKIPAISKNRFLSYMNDRFVWRFKLKDESLTPHEEQVPPEFAALAQKEGNSPRTKYEKNYTI